MLDGSDGNNSTSEVVYRIAGIFPLAKFSQRPLWLYYSNYLRVEFSRNQTKRVRMSTYL